MINRYRSSLLAVLASAILACWLPVTESAASTNDETEVAVCNPLADYFLGMEDYGEAISRHLSVIRKQPSNALAHYHLGFAYGMVGRHKDEMAQYRYAIDLGLSDWELFLNLGLLYLENGQLESATSILRLATLLGPDQPESHFNLGLAYERRGLLAQAEQETLLSLRLNPTEPDARNALGVIYAEEGNYAQAKQEWLEVVRSTPGYEPARTNLMLMGQVERSATKAAKCNACFQH